MPSQARHSQLYPLLLAEHIDRKCAVRPAVFVKLQAISQPQSEPQRQVSSVIAAAKTADHGVTIRPVEGPKMARCRQAADRPGPIAECLVTGL
jgi:hypothetical protein